MKNVTATLETILNAEVQDYFNHASVERFLTDQGFQPIGKHGNWSHRKLSKSIFVPKDVEAGGRYKEIKYPTINHIKHAMRQLHPEVASHNIPPNKAHWADECFAAFPQFEGVQIGRELRVQAKGHPEYWFIQPAGQDTQGLSELLNFFSTGEASLEKYLELYTAISSHGGSINFDKDSDTLQVSCNGQSFQFETKHGPDMLCKDMKKALKAFVLPLVQQQEEVLNTLASLGATVDLSDDPVAQLVVDYIDNGVQVTKRFPLEQKFGLLEADHWQQIIKLTAMLEKQQAKLKAETPSPAVISPRQPYPLFGGLLHKHFAQVGAESDAEIAALIQQFTPPEAPVVTEEEVHELLSGRRKGTPAIAKAIYDVFTANPGSGFHQEIGRLLPPVKTGR